MTAARDSSEPSRAGKRPTPGEFVKVTATKEPVVIWSDEHRLWWRAARSGYTLRPEEAGRYTISEAISATSHCGPEKQIRIEDEPPPAPENAELIHLRTSQAALLTACEMMLGGWTEWSDESLASSHTREDRAVLAMRAAVKLARGKGT